MVLCTAARQFNFKRVVSKVEAMTEMLPILIQGQSLNQQEGK